MEVIGKAWRVQADAVVIIALAEQRLADGYDDAQGAGEVGQSGSRSDLVPKGNEATPSAEDVGVTRKQKGL